MKWEILVKIIQKLVDIYMKIWKNLYLIPHSGNFSPTFVKENKVVVGLGTFSHLHTFLGRLPYKH